MTDHYDIEGTMTESELKKWKEEYEEDSSAEREKFRKRWEDMCKEYLETDSYKSGKTNTYGYGACCDILGMCGMSGWMIFLIILIVLLCLAGAAAAFWFFYLKRKMGGRDEEKEIESTADTANTGHDISVEIY